MCSCVSSVHFVSVFSKLVLLDLVYSVLSPEISWEERLRNEVFCVEWDILLTQSVSET